MASKLAPLLLASAVGLFCFDVLLNNGATFTVLMPAAQKTMPTVLEQTVRETTPSAPKPTISEPIVPERSAAEPSVGVRCQLHELPRELEGEAQASRCDDLIPRYDMVQWLREHGEVVPDHPAIFVNTRSQEAEVFKDPEAFLAQHGERRVVAKPEYRASGSYLQIWSKESRINITLRRLAEIWDDRHLYFSDFECLNGSLCAEVSARFGQPALFRLPAGRLRSRNFLIGGMFSGLPFHWHTHTWQGLSLGRKAWYIVPPGRMSEAMHNLTGPYTFPARTFHSSLLQEPVGKRPLFCVQHVGEVLFLPRHWWHATMNLDGYEVAYGEKPASLPMQRSSDALAKIMRVFSETPWDDSTDESSQVWTVKRPRMVYNFHPKNAEAYHTCGNNTEDLEQVLQWMQAPSNARAMACGLAEVVAWAHCRMARTVSQALRSLPKCNVTESRATEIWQKARGWRSKAKELSPALAQTEPICS